MNIYIHSYIIDDRYRHNSYSYLFSALFIVVVSLIHMHHAVYHLLPSYRIQLPMILIIIIIVVLQNLRGLQQLNKSACSSLKDFETS